MPLQIEFLNQLYRYKVEAQQNLEKLQEKDRTNRVEKDADWMMKIDDMEINHAQEVINRYANLIHIYLIIHSK